MKRKIIRNILKRELGTNDINDEFHNRYGYKPNITKQELKLKERMLKALKKLAHKKARRKKIIDKLNELEKRYEKQDN